MNKIAKKKYSGKISVIICNDSFITIKLKKY